MAAPCVFEANSLRLQALFQALKKSVDRDTSLTNTDTVSGMAGPPSQIPSYNCHSASVLSSPIESKFATDRDKIVANSTRPGTTLGSLCCVLTRIGDH